VFKDLGNYSERPKVAGAVIKAPSPPRMWLIRNPYKILW
jgi:hypothetical protein